MNSFGPGTNEAALEYMENKYGEKFEYSAPWGNSMSGTHEFLVTCKSLPDQKILVAVENHTRNDKVFLDNYLAVKYHDDTVDFLSDRANQVFGEATVFYDVAYHALSPGLPADAAFDEFLTDARLYLITFVEVKASDFASEEQAEKLAESIASSGAHFFIKLVIVNDSDYGKYDGETLEDKIFKNEFDVLGIAKEYGGEIKIEWIDKRDND
jgi:hypothetical protein